MMKLITRYVMLRLTIMSSYVLLAILALYSFIDLLGEVSKIGEGGYTAAVAVQYMMMLMPARAYQLMPLATLIGGLLALGNLSSNSELAVIKTSGLSTAHLISIILKFSAIFAVFTALLGEWLAPELGQRADRLRAVALNGQVAATKDGVWIKQDNHMVYVASMLPDKTLLGIKIWHYEHTQLIEAIAAEKAKVMDNSWLLQGVHSSRLATDSVQVSLAQERVWQSTVGNKLLDILLVEPEQMSFTALTEYIDYLKTNQQQTLMYEVAWWNKLVYPITTMVMSLLALAFTPVSSRHTNMGLKLVGGIGLGLLFFFIGRLFGFTSRLYHIPPFIAAILPTAVFALWAIYLIVKQERR